VWLRDEVLRSARQDVHRKVYGMFCARVTEVAKSMRQGPTLGAGGCCAFWGKGGSRGLWLRF
jgi:hypothetical protein